MAILNYISVTSTATPISKDPSSTSPDPRLTKVILPKKKPEKWSTGVAPGDYGGPPTTTKLRKYWGGEKEDPLTSYGFIWNKDFMPRMKKLIQEPSTQPTPEEPSGFLSINRVMSLDNLEVDLSKELTQTSNVVFEIPVEPATKEKIVTSPKWRLAPTRREQDKWDRAAKAATGGSEVLLREVRKPRGDPEVLAAQSREQYLKLKTRLNIYTLGIGGVGLVSAYVSYSPEIAVSFGAGLIGSLVYMRMLGSTIDSMADGAKGLIKGAVGQPRLLVPVILVMVYNRWNGILVPEYGIMQLQLIPMLVGLFTYKMATLVQAMEDVLTVAVENTSSK
ncbi:protein CONSERVED ONLY IN THE GREEN LINEAGE 160, chloroplastic isoform X2 [Euphorbia lathyris]|uniref:protein CONSERVED ONLY IN THE GREEN LINEAGE 160, chloroplastic isoform X2 n=1 Tax=Euphorbia lathyris TaxID=212925 RepID=UPI003313EDDA